MTAKITSRQEAAASERLRGDWDASGSTSVHLPRSVAEQLLADRGWVRHASAGRWVSPHGTWTWHTEDALQIALVSEATR